MNKVNTNNLPWESWSSPKGKFAGAGREVSEALGRKPQSTDLNERHPFDVESFASHPAKLLTPIIRTARNGSSITSFPAKAQHDMKMERHPSNPVTLSFFHPANPTS
jgi:hypothetical protein